MSNQINVDVLLKMENKTTIHQLPESEFQKKNKTTTMYPNDKNIKFSNQ